MKWNDDDQRLRFETTGREVDPNCAIVGMTAAGKLSVSDGYDGPLADVGGTLWVDGQDPGDRFHPVERRELAAHMVKRWEDWGGLERIMEGNRPVTASESQRLCNAFLEVSKDLKFTPKSSNPVDAQAAELATELVHHIIETMQEQLERLPHEPEDFVPSKRAAYGPFPFGVDEDEPLFTMRDVKHVRDVIRVEGPENFSQLANLADRLEKWCAYKHVPHSPAED